MKKILLGVMGVIALGLAGCRQNPTTACHIVGTVSGEQYEGKRIFLVPLVGPATAETVDSMEITNGQFEFSTDSTKMYKILLDYHYRFGLQPLLVVAEPGTVKVTIDTVSHATGTPLNDSLEQWKTQTEIHNTQLGKMRRYIAELKGRRDTVQAAYIQQRADSFHLVYKNYTRRLAKNVEGTPLGEFLQLRFPLTYKRKFPDGRIVTMNADTNEEIPE